MNKQKKQMLVLVIALVVFVGAYFAVSHFAANYEASDDGPNASMGNVTEALLEDTESTETTETTETVDGTEVLEETEAE
jgi:hypothetical protein